MADEYNFGGSPAPFGYPSSPSWNATPATPEPVEEHVEEPAVNDRPAADDENDNATEERETTEPEGQEEAGESTDAQDDGTSKPARRRRRQSQRKPAGSGHSAVNKETVERILALNDVLDAADERTFGLVKALAGLHYGTSKAGTIVALVDQNVRTAALRALNAERDIVGKLDDPFAIAIAFASLTRDERKEHWNRVLSCEKDTAADISGNESGVFSQNWKDAAKESTVLNQLYTRTKDDYIQRLNDAEAVLTSI